MSAELLNIRSIVEVIGAELLLEQPGTNLHGTPMRDSGSLHEQDEAAGDICFTLTRILDMVRNFLLHNLKSEMGRDNSQQMTLPVSM